MWVLEQLRAERGVPFQIRLDDGPRLICPTVADWCAENQVELGFIQLGKPQQSGFVEHFYGSFKPEFLDTCLFERLDQIRGKA